MYLDLEKNGALMHAQASNVEKNLKRTKAIINTWKMMIARQGNRNCRVISHPSTMMLRKREQKKKNKKE